MIKLVRDNIGIYELGTKFCPETLYLQGGVTRTYTVGRSATAVKLLTREILGLTLDLLSYLFLTFDFLDFLVLRRSKILYKWMCDASSGVGSCNKLQYISS